jgi:Holliday junction resolvase RusA-like endonuclease
MIYTFTIEGRFKPYVRMTQRGKYVKPEAREYLASKDAIAWQLNAEMHQRGWEMLPGQTPLWVEIRISPALHNRDLDNEAKALLDAMQGVVFPDDRWVDVLSAARGDNGGDEQTMVNVGVL